MNKNKILIILSLLKQSVDLLYENDNCLIKNFVHEQDISHRIAHYLENLLRNYDWFVKNGYSIDVEYNRRLDEPKRVYKKCSDCKRLECCLKTSNYNIDDYESICRPDIIIHKRMCNKQNIIAIEIKTNMKDCSKDYAKLAAFTCEENTYKYHLGIYINIDNVQSQLSFKYFKNGQEVNENDL